MSSRRAARDFEARHDFGRGTHQRPGRCCMLATRCTRRNGTPRAQHTELHIIVIIMKPPPRPAWLSPGAHTPANQSPNAVRGRPYRPALHTLLSQIKLRLRSFPLRAKEQSQTELCARCAYTYISTHLLYGAYTSCWEEASIKTIFKGILHNDQHMFSPRPVASG